MSVLAATALVTALVGLPAGAIAPPPGSVSAAAHVQVLDRTLGIVAVSVPRPGSTRALARLRVAPGVRYVSVPAAGGGLAASCYPPTQLSKVSIGRTSWRSTIKLAHQSAAAFTVGIPDSGADVSRLGGSRDRLRMKNFTQGAGVADKIDHGTEVASLIGANRPDLKVTGVAPDVGLAIARIASTESCNQAALSRNLIAAFAWFREIGDVQIVNVSVYIPPNPALIQSLRALQQSGTLVVAATGNKADPGKLTFPAGQPHVLGVGALGASSKKVWSSSGRGPQVDLVAPGIGSQVIVSSAIPDGPGPQTDITHNGTSFASPLVAGAAALVWAKHPAWEASRVSAALTSSAKHLAGATPNATSGYGRLDVKAALRASPPADLKEPNDWASAARALVPLAHKVVLHATVGGSDDPLDAYPVTTKGRSTVRVRGQGPLTAFLLSDRSLSAIEPPAAALAAASTRHATGASVQLGIPRKGRWYVVVTAPGRTAPIGYTLRAS